MIQGFLWTLLTVVLLSVLLNVVLMWPNSFSFRAHAPNLAFGVVIGFALWLNHRKMFRQALGIVIALLLGAAAYPLLFSGIAGNEVSLFLFYIPVVLAALLLGRRTLFFVALFAFFVVFLTPYLEATGQLLSGGPPVEPDWSLAAQFALVLGVALFFLDHIGTSLNRALRDMARRELTLKREVTERQMAQQRLTMALSVARMATFETDLSTQMVTGSEELERLYGLPATGGARPLSDYLELVHPQDRAVVLPLVPGGSSGPEGEVEFRIMRPDGAVVWLSSVSKAVPGADGSARRVVGIVMDTTQTKEAQLALENLNETLEERVAERTQRLQAANKELEAFAYSVSHDLRAPLRGLDGFSQLLLEEHASSLDEEALSYIRRIQAGANRMGELIDDLLQLSSIAGGEVVRRQVDLGAMATEIAAELNESNGGRRVDLFVDGPILTHGDPRLLRITLENVLSNAWKFMGDQEVPQVVFGTRRQGLTKVYYVKDNGVGFDMAYASKLFTPFQRLQEAGRFEGSGIGLATVQRIVHRHGGEIWGDGRPGEGATFSFTLEPSASHASRA